MGNAAASSRTSPEIRSSSASSPRRTASTPREIHSAIRSISGSAIPRVVTAGVPSRRPEGSEGFRGSRGTAFAFVVIPARSRARAAAFPGTPLDVRSTRIRWVSVPPETRSNPRSRSAQARALAFATTWRA